MLRYLETYYRHRLLLMNPLILAVAVSLGLVLIQPRTYEASAKVWFDPATTSSGAAPGTFITPADQGAAELKELLKTRSFCAKVGRRGPLASDLATTGSAVPDLGSRIIGVLRGTQGLSLANPDVLDDLLYATLSGKTRVEAGGPEIVGISFDYSKAEVAAGTVQAILDQMSDELVGNRRAEAQAAFDFYKQQVKAEADALAAADANVFQYLQGHPSQRAPGAVEDVALTSLRYTDDLARERYRDLLLKFDQAQVDAAAVSQPGAAGFRVIDSPIVPYRPKGFIKAAAFAAIGGLLAGLVLTLVALMALTAADTSARRWEDLDGSQLGRRVIGAIPRIR